MSTLLAVLVIYGLGFFMGYSQGLRTGYDNGYKRAYAIFKKVTDRIEALYRDESQ